MRRYQYVVLLQTLAFFGCGQGSKSTPGDAKPDGGGDVEVGDAGGSAAIVTDAGSEYDGVGTIDGTSADHDAASGSEDASSSSVDSGEAGAASQCGSEVEFRVVAAPGFDPSSLCLMPCDGVSLLLTSGATQLWVGFVWTPDYEVVWTASPQRYFRGAASCDTCSSPPSSSCAGGVETFPVDGISRTWPGTYFAVGATCNGQACMGPALCAPAGHYTATACATRGSTSGNVCSPTQDTACGAAEFDLPSTTTVTIGLGP
jgi:hypothetical protein